MSVNVAFKGAVLHTNESIQGNSLLEAGVGCTEIRLALASCVYIDIYIYVLYIYTHKLYVHFISSQSEEYAALIKCTRPSMLGTALKWAVSRSFPGLVLSLLYR